MRGAPVEQPNLFADRSVPLHVLSAFGALVQLFPAIRPGLVIGHEAASMGWSTTLLRGDDFQRDRLRSAIGDRTALRSTAGEPI